MIDKTKNTPPFSMRFSENDLSALAIIKRKLRFPKAVKVTRALLIKTAISDLADRLNDVKENQKK